MLLSVHVPSKKVSCLYVFVRLHIAGNMFLNVFQKRLELSTHSITQDLK